MDPANLWTAIRNRVLADTTAGGLRTASDPLITEIYENNVPNGAQMPYIVYDLEYAIQMDGFRTALYQVQFRFGVYVSKDSVVSTEATTRASKIIGRLRGNWQDKSYGTGPDYGFDRVILSLSGDWTAGMCTHVDSRALHEAEALHYVETYRLHLSQAGA